MKQYKSYETVQIRVRQGFNSETVIVCTDSFDEAARVAKELYPKYEVYELGRYVFSVVIP